MKPTSIAFRFLLHSLALLILAALVRLFAGWLFLPGAPVAPPFDQVDALAAALLDLALVAGLIGGGIYALTPDQPSRLLDLAALLWLPLVIGTLLAGALGWLIPLYEGFAILKALVIALALAAVVRATKTWTAVAWVWAVSLGLSAICALVPPSQFLAPLPALASGLNCYVAEVLAALALLYWLIERFSTISRLWAEMSLYTVAGLMALAGSLVTLGTLGMISPVFACIVPPLCLLFASHTYAAFSSRNSANTLAAHWAALGVLLLIGVGLLGGAQAALHEWMAGTRLSDLLPTLAQMAVAAILLGVCNQISAELRKENRRVTGLMPFWLVAFGAVGGGLALAGAGLAQGFLQAQVGYLDAQGLIAPLYALWIGGLALLALGLILYGLIFWLRRPRASA